ncbi:MAG: alpha/beta hydrolase [Oscillospiraceae bacterium]|nr:alpha/beta hydrolase [Oscillospiraceae bacterium]
MEPVLYIHGKGGSPEEAAHYRPLFPSGEVIGIEYHGDTPEIAGKEIRDAVAGLAPASGAAILIANSIGAYFAMNADIERYLCRAFFISPIVDLERLILDRMDAVGVTEPELREKDAVPTPWGEALSWQALCRAREQPVRWSVPTDILYGSGDDLTSIDTIKAFARHHGARLTVMEHGEHWFHTEEQMRFLDRWIRDSSDR